MNFSDASPSGRAAAFRPFLAVSLALHAALGALLYYFGAYQVEQRQGDVQVSASMQATYHARSARRIEDLQKIKELMEQSARSAPEPEAPVAAPKPVADDPREQLVQARELSKAIDEISRDLRAEEQARLTGVSKEQARKQIDAEMAGAPAPPQPADPADEIAALEQQARELLARRAQDLQRQQDGVQVSAGNDAARGDGKDAAISSHKGTQAGEGGHGDTGQQGSSQSDGAVAARIDDFLNQGIDPARIPRVRTPAGRLVNHGNGHVPAVGREGTRKGHGRMLGAGGQYAERIFLNSWYMIGPFPGSLDGSGAVPVHPPEQAVLLDAVYRGKDRQLLKWEYVGNAAYPLIPREPVEKAVYYAYTEVLMDEERELLVWLGVDDDATVYLNDKIVWQSDNRDKGWFFASVYRDRWGHDRDFNRTERQLLVRFKKGRNKVFVKVWNDTQEMFFSMVLTLPRQPPPA